MGYIRDCFNENFSEKEKAIAQYEREMKKQNGVKGQFKQGIQHGAAQMEQMHSVQMQAVMMNEYMADKNARTAQAEADAAKQSADVRREQYEQSAEIYDDESDTEAENGMSENLKYQIEVCEARFGHLTNGSEHTVNGPEMG